jgi:hypothetical protein
MMINFAVLDGLVTGGKQHASFNRLSLCRLVRRMLMGGTPMGDIKTLRAQRPGPQLLQRPFDDLFFHDFLTFSDHVFNPFPTASFFYHVVGSSSLDRSAGGVQEVRVQQCDNLSILAS